LTVAVLSLLRFWCSVRCAACPPAAVGTPPSDVAGMASGAPGKVSPWQQLRWLIWKNLLRKRRAPAHTLGEFAMPLVFVVALLLIRTSFTDVHVEQQAFTAQDSGRQLSAQAHALLRTAACGCERDTGGGFFDGARANMQAIAFTGVDDESSAASAAALAHVRQRLLTAVGASSTGNASVSLTCDCAPPNDQSLNITAYVDSQGANPLLRHFSSAAALDEYLASAGYLSGARPLQQLDKAVVLSGIGNAANGFQWSYTLRSNGSDLAYSLTDVTDDSIAYRNSSFARPFLDSGLLTLQMWMDEWIVQQSAPTSNNSSGATLDAAFYPMPVPARTFDSFASNGAPLFGLFLMLALQWPFARLVKQLVDEKERKLKEGLHIIGVSEFAHQASWAIPYTAGFALLAAIISALIKLFVFPLCDVTLVFVWLFEFTLSLVLMALLCSSVFDSAKLAGLLAPILVYAQSVPYFAVQAGTASAGVNQFISLFPVSAFCMGAQQIAHLEQQGVGARWSTIVLETQHQHYSLAASLIWLAVGMLLIRAITVYCDMVITRQYGAPTERWFFPLQPSYYRRAFPGIARFFCCGERDAQSTTLRNVDPLSVPLSGSIDFKSRSALIEARDDPLPAGTGVTLHALRKEFELERAPNESLLQRACSTQPRPTRTAVDDLSMEFREGEITVLLGHNGAGKTTTMSMLCGLTPPTSGSARVCGLDLRTEMSAIRQQLSVCPQHTTAWSELTVDEHLRLYAALKGVSSSDLSASVDRAVSEVTLEEKRHSKCSDLSGGQQRRLNLAMALIGDSKVIYLDEPTSGVDPLSRRAVWQLLRSKRAGRVIILSTHFMDEADELGDAVAILSRGRIKCMGSPLFLKHKFGVGYSLMLSKQQGQDTHAMATAVHDHEREEESKAPAALAAGAWDPAALTRLVKERVSGAEQLSHSGGELSYRLPLGSAGAVLPDLFDYLDANRCALGLQNYALSVTTLEDIFLQIAAEEEQQQVEERGAEKESTNQQMDGRKHRPISAADSIREPLLDPAADGSASSYQSSSSNGNAVIGVNAGGIDVAAALEVDSTDLSWYRQVRALMRKRMHVSRRDTKALLCSIGVPCYLLIVAVIVASVSKSSSEYGSLLLAPAGQFPQPSPVYTNGAVNEFIADALADKNNGLGAVNHTLPAAFTWSDMQTQMFAFTRDSPSVHYGAYFGLAASQLDFFSCATNTSAPFAQPTFLNLADTAILRGRTSYKHASIATTLQPFERTPNEKHSQSSFSGLSLSMMVALAFGFIPTSFAVFIVYERETRSKHLQLLSGVQITAYWTANALWDLVIFAIPACVCLIILACDGNESFTGRANLPVLLLALLLYGTSCIPFCYVASWAFHNHLTAQNVLVLVSLVGGMGLSIVNFMLWSSAPALSRALRFVFRLLPTYALADTLFYMSVGQAAAAGADGSSGTAWDLDMAGYDLLYMALESVLYFAAVLLIEWLQTQPELLEQLRDFFCDGTLSDFFCPAEGAAAQLSPADDGVSLPHQCVEDSDVIAERVRVQSGAARDAPIQLHGLRKVFSAGTGPLSRRPKVAVDNLFFTVQTGECFGFLGQNGAGKTTTLSMLTSELYPTSGTARLHGFDLRTEAASARRFMGFCPQHDVLDGRLTATETLHLFATIRGVPERDIARVSEALLARLGLLAHKDQAVSGYSGGTKRKLSVAVALIGNPAIVCLDEPSTGMDPLARRFMWTFLSETMSRRSVILTTHSMEEAEALCSRIGIIRSGVLQCVGSSQHLKTRFGSGFRIELRMPAAFQPRARQWLQAHFPQSREVEITETRIKLQTETTGAADAAVTSAAPIASSAAASSSSSSFAPAAATAAAAAAPSPRPLCLSSIFRLLEGARAELHLTDYAVGQTSLEDIFLALAGQKSHDG